MSGTRSDSARRAAGQPGDYHVHTTYSDGSGTASECVEQAIAAGLCEIGIADHLSAVQPTPWDSASIPFAELDRYVAEVRGVAARYGEITVLLGVEADYVPEHEAELAKLLSAYPFDYVVGGVHVIDGFDFKNPDYAAVFAKRVVRLNRIRADPDCLPDLKVVRAGVQDDRRGFRMTPGSRRKTWQ